MTISLSTDNISVPACVGPMIFVIGIGYLGCNNVGLVVMLIVFQELFRSAARGAVPVATIDIAPQ